MNKVFILLTVVGLLTFSSIILANDFDFPGISTEEQVRLELWVKGIQKGDKKANNSQKKLGIELEMAIDSLKL